MIGWDPYPSFACPGDHRSSEMDVRRVWLIGWLLLVGGGQAFDPYQVLSLSWSLGKMALRVGMAFEKAMLKDQLAVGLIAIREATKVTSFATPWLWKGSVLLGKTGGTLLLETTWRMVRRTLDQLGFGAPFAAIRQGPAAACDLIHYLKTHGEEFTKRPLLAPLLLQQAVKGGPHRGHLLLPLLISYTKGYLVAERGSHELYATALVDVHLPSAFLRQALRDSPLTARAFTASLGGGKGGTECRLGKEWWVYEFMSKIVGFPPTAFRNYLQVFFEFHPTLDNNPVLQLIEANPPPLPQTLSSLLDYQVMFVANLRGYYLLREPSLIRSYTWRHGLNFEQMVECLEFFLSLSGTLAQLHQEPPDSRDRAMLQRWVTRLLESALSNGNYGSTGTLEEELLQHDAHRVFKLLNPRATRRHQIEAMKHCACRIYSRILPRIPRDRHLPPPSGSCACIRVMHRLVQTLPTAGTLYRCSDRAVRVAEIILGADATKEIAKAESSGERAIALGLTLDMTLNMERDEAAPPEVLVAERPGAALDQLLNEALQLRCERYHRWPSVRYAIETQPSGSSLRLGKSLAISEGERVRKSPSKAQQQPGSSI